MNRKTKELTILMVNKQKCYKQSEGWGKVHKVNNTEQNARDKMTDNLEEWGDISTVDYMKRRPDHLQPKAKKRPPKGQQQVL